ncbi:MAG: cupin domain-containing protein [bacterium]
MKILHFGPDTAEAIDKYGSNFKMSHPHTVGRELFVGCMHIPPGGHVGYHRATIPQLLMVVSGQGWVRAGQEDRLRIQVGEAVLWDADEWHEAGSDTGMMAVVVEYNLGGPVKQFKARGRTWWIYMASGSEREQLASAQLERLLIEYDLTRWAFTTHIRIDGSAPIPYSHPVLTLNARYHDHDGLALATFLHEQIHWFVTERWSTARAAIEEFRQLYPHAPNTPPEGAQDESSTYLHLIVNYQEFTALRELLGADAARRILEFWQHYTWIYRTVLNDTNQIAAVVARHGLGI